LAWLAKKQQRGSSRPERLEFIFAESPIKPLVPPRFEPLASKVAPPLLKAVSLVLPAHEQVPLHGQQQARLAVTEIQADRTKAQAGNNAGRQRLDEDAKKPKTI
jgi:hypothetical protein